jgi:hypothetical protein
MKKIVSGIVGKKEDIDKIIKEAAPDWPLEKISNIDRNVLRVGLFELLFSDRDILEDVLNKLAIENDSLKKEIDILDSLYRDEREKNLLLANKKDSKESSKEYKTRGKKSNLTKVQEYDKKALYMYNFTSYVSWPHINSSKFLIGVAGSSNINSFLAAYTNGKSITNLPIVVQPYKAGENYQIVFVSSSALNEFAKIKKEVSGKPILLVTENAYLQKTGSHISFYVDGDKVNFLVNKPAIEKSGLSVNSKLLNFSGN